MGRLKFVDPSPDKDSPFDWPVVARELKRNPERWALLTKQGMNSWAITIRQGGIAALRPENGYEIKTRNNKRPADGPRTCDIYLRYVPERDSRVKSVVEED